MMISTPNKAGQIVKFHTPLGDENPEQQYVVTEIHLETDRPRAQIQALNTRLPFPPVNTVSVKDLEVVNVDTADLIGYPVTVKTDDGSEVSGEVVSIDTDKIYLDMNLKSGKIETNVTLTVKDKNNLLHKGYLVV